ncbi:plasmid stabilization protein [Methylobacterium sp. Leaf399]|uniref:type II toxin-antitoxin system RelE/ParE family toxin n=1 Tax=unclassified Methylobacterium TaxID=2615210 RepID=UPI0007016100|nr:MULTISPECIES: type II toxin-antitoxin system RelE/ParE family toxin [unclassified Methylobacterium]KQP50944.1 plasmid stabilization protein [Methylobacterium sp. Leaf108]KQT07928.1 plasmid stabilization protein [Methylobacterium sp. Leaf399]
MAAELVFREAAQTDLFSLYHYIAEQSGRARAGAYIDRLEAACFRLRDFPERGTRRDDLRPGLRTIGFERRVTIVFSVDEEFIVIGRILYGGRDLDTLLGEPG